MDKWQSLIEQHIEKARREGQFDNLPGYGKPLPPDKFRHAPEELRMTLRILKNAGVMPREVELNQKIAKLKEELEGPGLSATKQRALKSEIQFLELDYQMRLEKVASSK